MYFTSSFIKTNPVVYYVVEVKVQYSRVRMKCCPFKHANIFQ